MKLVRNYMDSQVPLSNQNNVWLRIIITRSRVKSSLIKEEYDIPSKPATAGKPHIFSIIDRIHQVLGNFIQMFELDKYFVSEDKSLKGILVIAYFLLTIGFIKPSKITQPISIWEIYDYEDTRKYFVKTL